MSNKITGFYYLHENGKLIYKPHANAEDLMDSSLVIRFWSAPQIGATPDTFLNFLVDAKEQGALQSEIQRLHDFNHLSDFLPEAKALLEVS